MTTTATDSPDLLEGFRKGIWEFAEEFVANPRYHRQFPRDGKIIHDPLWGTIKLEAWEVALLDLPLFQRLRQIHQTSLVSYVFPGCNHSRFEHTLGVVQQTKRLTDAVNAHILAVGPGSNPRLCKTYVSPPFFMIAGIPASAILLRNYTDLALTWLLFPKLVNLQKLIPTKPLAR